MRPLNPCNCVMVPSRFATHQVTGRSYGADSASRCLHAIVRKWQLRALQLRFSTSAVSYQRYLFKSAASQHTVPCRIA